jgi:hypothetical protein
MAENTNIKANLEKTEAFDHPRSWKDTTPTEIGAFVEILLYMGIYSMPRIKDYWNLDPSRAIHAMILNCMTCQR